MQKHGKLPFGVLPEALRPADITEGINRGEGTLGRLAKDEALIDSVERTAEDTGELV